MKKERRKGKGLRKINATADQPIVGKKKKSIDGGGRGERPSSLVSQRRQIPY